MAAGEDRAWLAMIYHGWLCKWVEGMGINETFKIQVSTSINVDSLINFIMAEEKKLDAWFSCSPKIADWIYLFIYLFIFTPAPREINLFLMLLAQHSSFKYDINVSSLSEVMTAVRFQDYF